MSVPRISRGVIGNRASMLSGRRSSKRAVQTAIDAHETDPQS